MLRSPLVLAAAGLLVACAVKQPGSIEETASEALPESTRIPLDYAAAANAAQGEVIDGWLKNFGDPQLEAIVAEAITNNLDLRAAVARVDQAAGIAVQSGVELKPGLGAGGSAKNQQSFAASDPDITATGVALNSSWELDLWGRVRSQAQAGGAAFEAAQYQLQWVYQSVAAQTAKSWFLVTEASLQQLLAEEALGLYQHTLQIVEAKYAQGRVTQGEVSLARANVAAGQAQVRQAQGARQQASRALELLLGRYPSAEIEGAAALNAVPPPIPVGLPSQLLERRPDLRAAERAIAAQFLQIQSAQAARLPRITLTAALGSSSGALTDVVALGSDYWSIGANFAAPIFTGGALAAQVDIESAEFQQAMANYGSLALRAFAEVEQSLSNESLLRERESFLQQVVDESTDALRVATAQFKVGRVSLLDVLQQQAQVIGAQADLIRLQDLRLQQRVDLHLALGGSFEQVASGNLQANPDASSVD